MEDVRILDLSDREGWEEEHRNGGLPTQTWAYAAALRHSGLDPRLAVVRSGDARMLLPYVERTWEVSADIASIPGLSGASISSHSGLVLGLWREYAISQGWVSGYLQLSPYASIDALPQDTIVVRQNSSFVFNPLTWSEESTYRTIRERLRYARRDGAVTSDGPHLLDALQMLYPRTMQRFAAAVPYSRETIAAWARDAGTVLVGVALDGEIHGVHLLHIAGKHAEATISGTTERGRDFSAMLYSHAIQLLAARGVEHYNVGAGGNPGDGLYEFKKWLGATPLDLRSVRQIYDPIRYRELCVRAGVETASGWFPAYRAKP